MEGDAIGVVARDCPLVADIAAPAVVGSIREAETLALVSDAASASFASDAPAVRDHSIAALVDSASGVVEAPNDPAEGAAKTAENEAPELVVGTPEATAEIKGVLAVEAEGVEMSGMTIAG